MSANPAQTASPLAFEANTRQKYIEMPTITKPTGGGTVSVQIPRTGLLARIFLIIRGSIAGTITGPNALGKASVINRVRLFANSGIDIFNVSGAGYHYLLRKYLNLGNDTAPQSDAKTAIAVAAFNLDMVIPVALNTRDPLGLLMLQSEQTVLTLSIQFEADNVVATGGPTVTCTVQPILEVFTVPQDRRNWPRLDVVHQILEDQIVISGAGQYPYQWPRGNRYLQVLHGCGINVAAADSFTHTQLRVNQSDFIFSFSDAFRWDIIRNFLDLAIRGTGTIPIDLMGTSGLGVFDRLRDTVDSSRVTDLATVITTTGALTLYTVRRQLVQLTAPVPGPSGA